TFDFDWDILKLGLYRMRKTKIEGLFACKIPLPSGTFNYRFVLDMPDGNPLKMVTVTDPVNPPFTVGDKVQPYSQVYVPFDSQKQVVDRSVELPVDDGGRLEVFEYETDPAFGVGEKQKGVIYLPKDYDPESPCPVLYLSHGGGDNAASWINQGSLKNIMDHLIAAGRTEPMAVVLMDNEVFHWDNPGKCIPNLTGYLIPWVESTYAVGGNPGKRAFAGFSAGGFLAYEVLVSCPEWFNYIGVWSGGKRVNDLPDTGANRKLQVHIGAGRYDDAFFTFGYKLEDLLHEEGIPFTSYFPDGGHQWSVWRQLLEDFCGRVLWR
ncbi:alpha/beta hydrolase, partial [Catenibacillus scindens]